MYFARLLWIALSMSLLTANGLSQTIPNLTNSPLTFLPNLGQSSAETSYAAEQGPHRIYINDSSITYVVPATEKSGAIQRHVLKLRWKGLDRESRLNPQGLLPGKSNYFLGDDATRWIINVPHYSELKQSDVMPGVDLRYHSSIGGDLEYDLIVAPNTDLRGVGLVIDGADQVSLNGDGSLLLRVGGTELRQLPPSAYEMRGNRKAAIKVAYVLNNNEITFAVRGRSPGLQMVVDPVLQYATFLGGSKSSDFNNCGATSLGASVAIDPAGNFYVTGQTTTLDFPVTKGALLQTGTQQCLQYPESYVTKFSKSGQLLYSTYLSGDDGTSYRTGSKLIVVDADGIAYVTGTAGRHFPTTTNAYQKTCESTVFAPCAFLAKLNQDGSQLLYSTYLRGSQPSDYQTWTSGLALDPWGDVYLTGTTTDPSLPTTPRAYQTTCPLYLSTVGLGMQCYSAFASRFNTNVSGAASLVFSTYLGLKGGNSSGNAIAIDKYGDAYVVGTTTIDFPHIAAFGNGSDPTFVAKLNGSSGNLLRPATLLRGVNGATIAVDKSLNVFVAGTAASGMATTEGAYQTKFGGGESDGFVAKLDPDGYSLLFSTFLGGSLDDTVNEIALNNNGIAFVTGTTSSKNFPIALGAFKNSFSPTWGVQTAYVTAVNADGRALYYSSYLGGTNYSSGSGIALDPAWNAYVTGTTSDSDFPITPGAFQSALKGTSDAFVAKVVIAGDLGASVTTSTSSIARNGVVIYHARLTNYGPDGSDNVVFTDSIPAGMSYAGVYVPSGNGCTEPKAGATNGTLTCRKTRLESGQTYYVNVYLRAVGKSGMKTTNQVRVSAQTQDLKPANNSAIATVLIQ